jgi:hypothetical protein
LAIRLHSARDPRPAAPGSRRIPRER